MAYHSLYNTWYITSTQAHKLCQHDGFNSRCCVHKCCLEDANETHDTAVCIYGGGGRRTGRNNAAVLGCLCVRTPPPGRSTFLCLRRNTLQPRMRSALSDMRLAGTPQSLLPPAACRPQLISMHATIESRTYYEFRSFQHLESSPSRHAHHSFARSFS